MSDNPWCGRTGRGYCSRFHDKKTRKRNLYFPMCSINKKIYYCNRDFGLGSQLRTWFIKTTIIYPVLKLIDIFTSLISITSLVELIFCLFYSCSIDTILFQYFCLLRLKLSPCLVVIFCLNECDDISVIHLYCNGFLHSYNRL